MLLNALVPTYCGLLRASEGRRMRRNAVSEVRAAIAHAVSACKRVQSRKHHRTLVDSVSGAMRHNLGCRSDWRGARGSPQKRALHFPSSAPPQTRDSLQLHIWKISLVAKGQSVQLGCPEVSPAEPSRSGWRQRKGFGVTNLGHAQYLAGASGLPSHAAGLRWTWVSASIQRHSQTAG